MIIWSWDLRTNPWPVVTLWFLYIFHRGPLTRRLTKKPINVCKMQRQIFRRIPISLQLYVTYFWNVGSNHNSSNCELSLDVQTTRPFYWNQRKGCTCIDHGRHLGTVPLAFEINYSNLLYSLRILSFNRSSRAVYFVKIF